MSETLSPIIQKFIDANTENYFKKLMEGYKTDKVLQNINPYIGVLRYPSSQFLNSGLTYSKTVQFQSLHYVGLMELLLPDLDAPVNSGLSYTLLQFELDGVVRKFLQISQGNTVVPIPDVGVGPFKDFVLSLHKGANEAIPFNRNAYHILTDVQLSGAVYDTDPVSGQLVVAHSGPGAFAPAIEFEIAISGYKCLLL